MFVGFLFHRGIDLGEDAFEEAGFGSVAWLEIVGWLLGHFDDECECLYHFKRLAALLLSADGLRAVGTVLCDDLNQFSTGDVVLLKLVAFGAFTAEQIIEIGLDQPGHGLG